MTKKQRKNAQITNIRNKPEDKLKILQTEDKVKA